MIWLFIIYCSLLFLCKYQISGTIRVDRINQNLRKTNVMMTTNNEDALLNFTQLTSKYGYHSEEHKLVTKDGYILTVFRIPLGKKCLRPIESTPVLMMHGLIDSSDSYIIAGPNVGLAYILADACHDVWCGNVRGNMYSRNHATLDPDKDVEFWDYSYHEHGIYDLSATVDYVLYKTRAARVNYIAHSQGTTAFFVLNSILSEYHSKFNIALLLAPIAWLFHVTGPFFHVFAQKYHTVLKPQLLQVDVHEILSQNEKEFMFLELFCKYLPETMCDTAITAVFGESPKNISSETISAVFGHMPAGTSIKNLEHFAQAVQKDVFQQFNYGIENNTIYYKQEDPPEYNLSKINVPVVLFSGLSDPISRPADVTKLLSRLPNVVESVTLPDDSWSHLHFVLGDRIPILLAPKVFQYFNVYSYH